MLRHGLESRGGADARAIEGVYNWERENAGCQVHYQSAVDVIVCPVTYSASSLRKNRIGPSKIASSP